MRIIVYVLVAVVFSIGSAVARAADVTSPHIIFVMADDMGWGQTGYRNHPVLKTPNLDAMAASGLRFERFYAGCPVCSPTRASVLTGRSPDRAGVLQHGYALRSQEKTIAQALKTRASERFARARSADPGR
jgi:arylsulfatase A-like enzyme